MNNTYFTHVNKNNCENCDIDLINKYRAKIKTLPKNNGCNAVCLKKRGS